MEFRTGTAEEVGMSPERVRRVVELAKGWVEQGITPALVIFAARKGVILLNQAFGCLTPEPDSSPVRRHTIFPLASMTKTITSTAPMVLVEDGLLGPNRPVSEYIPEFVGEGKDAVMVHHLMTHTSGLRDNDIFTHAEKKLGCIEIPPSDETQHPRVNEYLFLGYDTPLWKPPGTEMSYCNYGYSLLGEVVRRVSRQSFSDFVRARIFEPLGMEGTDYIVPDTARHRVVKRPSDAPYAESNGQYFTDTDWPKLFARLADGFNSLELQQTPWACRGAYSTAMDMARFGQMFLNGGNYGETRILSPASVVQMTRNQIPGIGARYGEEVFPEASWGFGWNIHGQKKSGGTLCSPKTFSHGGAGGVYLWVDPVYEIVGVCLSVSLHNSAAPIDLFINAVTAAAVDV